MCQLLLEGVTLDLKVFNVRISRRKDVKLFVIDSTNGGSSIVRVDVLNSSGRNSIVNEKSSISSSSSDDSLTSRRLGHLHISISVWYLLLVYVLG